MNDNMIETNRLNISTLGNSSVTLKHQEGSIAKYITYNVNIVPFIINVNSVALDIVSSDVLRTQSVQLNPIITPLNGLVRDIKWSSSNPLIARIDNNGLVTPLNAGEVIITVTVNNLYSAASRLNILQDEIKEVVEEASQPVTLDPTADLTFALTTPSPSGTNLISTNQATSPKTVSINVENNTSSVVITATKLASQTVVVSGTNLADVTAAGTSTTPTYTVNTTSIATSGGSKVFTLTVSEANKEDIVYNVTINVESAIPPTANLTFNLTTPAASGSNTITVNQAASPKTISINVVNNTSSVVITAGKTNDQSVAISGSNSSLVTAGGTVTAPTYSVNSSSVAANGGTLVFTLTVSESNNTNIIYNVTIIVAVPPQPTANITYVLTAPNPSGSNTITVSQDATPKTVSIVVINTTTSVVITASKLEQQSVAITGTNSGLVTAGGNATTPTYSVNTTSVATNGGTLVFTLTISENNQTNIIYNFTINVSGPTPLLLLDLDASNVSSYSGSGNTWTNLVDNNNFTISPSGVFDSANGGSIVFNGSTIVALDTLLVANTSYSYEAWVYDNPGSSGARNIISSFSNVFWINGTTLSAGVGGSYSLVTYNNFPKGVWKHVAVTFNTSTNTMVLFVDGVQVAQPNSNVVGEVANEFLRIGAHSTAANPGSAVSFWNGRIASVKIYNYALTQNTVQTNFETTRAKFEIVTQSNLSLELDPHRYSGTGNLLDTSVNTNNATISGATFDNAGKFFSFDGTNDSMTVADNATIEPTTGSFSLEAWVYPTSSSTSQIIIAKTDGGLAAQWGYGLRLVAGDLRFDVGDGSDSSHISVALLTLNTWHHVIAVYDNRADGHYKIYLNSVVEASAPRPYSSIRNTTAPLSIGLFPSFNQWFEGRIGEVRYYGKALSEQEVTNNFNARKDRYGIS
jgi:hypothetical protein